ncbi:MAG: alpha-N-arabinofuranosidase [Omnitrophica WOR_2 bacterium]
MPRVVINPADKIGVISPYLYGHFTEHLGRCFYDGVWVGENSPVPNTAGFRNDILAALRKIKPSVIRWPGGCFADDYHWQDGVGPRQSRPRRTNIHWGEVVETNEVGTQEFVRFCRLVGAEPYICGNVGSGTVRELRDWVEYCNFTGDSSWAQQRLKDGSPEPLGVTFWGIGNESWGCGGNFSPEDYCTEFRRYASFVRGFGKRLFVIACGPSGNDLEWTQRFFDKLFKDYRAFNNIQGFAAHYYCGTAGTATEYSEEQWYQLIAQGLEIEPLIVQQRLAMDAYDPQRQIGLVIDEWGTWHPVEKGTNPAFLFQQNTLRDALVAATNLDIFNRQADKIVMANIAQMVNVLQSMVLTEGEKMLVTPTGLVYTMYAPHQGGEAVRWDIETEMIAFKSGEKEIGLPMLAGSASIKGKALFLTLTNQHAVHPVEVQVGLLGGARATSSLAFILTGEIHAHNTFDQPDAVSIQPMKMQAFGNSFTVAIPPASVVAAAVSLE